MTVCDPYFFPQDSMQLVFLSQDTSFPVFDLDYRRLYTVQGASSRAHLVNILADLRMTEETCRTQLM